MKWRFWRVLIWRTRRHDLRGDYEADALVTEPRSSRWCHVGIVQASWWIQKQYHLHCLLIASFQAVVTIGRKFNDGTYSRSQNESKLLALVFVFIFSPLVKKPCLYVWEIASRLAAICTDMSKWGRRLVSYRYKRYRKHLALSLPSQILPGLEAALTPDCANTQNPVTKPTQLITKKAYKHNKEW